MGTNKHTIGHTATDLTVTPEFITNHAIYNCVVGSRAFGLSGPESDTDIRGIYQLGADSYRSLSDPPEVVHAGPLGGDEEYWELRHFLRMALKANPNVIEALFSPLGTTYNEIGRELVASRHSLLSRKAYETYNGYVAAQYRKIEQD